MNVHDLVVCIRPWAVVHPLHGLTYNRCYRVLDIFEEYTQPPGTILRIAIVDDRGQINYWRQDRFCTIPELRARKLKRIL